MSTFRPKLVLSNILRTQIKFMSENINSDYNKRKLTKSRSKIIKSSSNVPEYPCKRIIVDCDVGTDDAVALYILLAAELKKLVKIEMICCTRGNTTLENVCRNTIRLLEAAKRLDIPVYKGSHHTLIPYCDPEDYFHGVDGFGDLKHDREPDLSIIRSEPSFVAMRKLIMRNPDQITLVCLAPLTNIALLMRLYGGVVKSKIKELYVMGGNHLGIGNITQSAEFNFFLDPEAAHVVLSCTECPFYLLTWETCLETLIPIKWRMENLGSTGADTWKLITRAENVIYKNLEGNWMPCDAYLVAGMLYPEMILQRIQRHVAIELAGRLTRGQVAIDHNNKKTPNVTLIQKVDNELFKTLMLDLHTMF